MDPVSLIVAACVASLTADVTKYDDKEVFDSCQAFKTYLWSKVETSEDTKMTLIALEKSPDSEGRQHSMKMELLIMGIEKDPVLIHLAQTLLKQLDAKGTQSGKYIVDN